MPPLHPLLGRDAAFSAWARLRAAGARRITLIGPPGVGKTAFLKAIVALEPGARLVDLGGAHAASAEVLLLDDADDADEAALLALPHPVVVIASHRRRHLPGEHLLELDPLGLPPPDAALAEVASSPAVRCFLGFARAVAPELELDAATAGPISALCWATDGLPAALERVAAHLRVLSVGALAERLASGAGLLPGGLFAPLAAPLGRVVARLSAGARGALTAMAVCPSALLPDTALALAADSGDPLALVTELRDASLLVRGGDHLRVLSLVRAVVLQGADVAAVARGVADRLSVLAAVATERYTRAADASALRWLQAEQQNVAAAFGSVVAPAGACAEDAIAWRLANAILVLHSRYSVEWYRHEPLRRVFRFTEAPGRLEQAPLAALVELAARLYDFRELERLENVVDVALVRAPHDPGVLWAHASVASGRHDLSELTARAERALRAARDANEPFWESRAHALLLIAAHARGDWREARTQAEAGVRCAEALGSEAIICTALPNLVFLCARLGERTAARRHAERAIAMAERTADARCVATATANWAYAEMDWDELAHAESLLRQALELHDRMGRADFAALTQVSLARTRLLRGDTESIEAELAEAERRVDSDVYAADRAVTALWAAEIRADLLERRRDWSAALSMLRASVAAHDPGHGEEDLLVPLGRCAALAQLLGDDGAHAFRSRGEAIRARATNPHLRVAFDVYTALGASDWPAPAARLASLARVPLAGAPRTEGGEPAFHSSLAVRAALAFVWPQLSAEQRADVEADAVDPGREALLIALAGARFRVPGAAAFVELSHRPALVRLLGVLAQARLESPPRALTESDLVTALWPGERILPAAATNRLQNALSLLRRAGLGEHVVFTAAGYLLRPDGRVAALEAGPEALRVHAGGSYGTPLIST